MDNSKTNDWARTTVVVNVTQGSSPAVIRVVFLPATYWHYFNIEVHASIDGVLFTRTHTDYDVWFEKKPGFADAVRIVQAHLDRADSETMG